MAIWKTKWGWRAEFVQEGKRIMAKGTFKYKDEARQWEKEEKKRLKENPEKNSSQDKDLSLWTLSQKYLADSKINFDKKTVDEKLFCLERFYNEMGDKHR